MDSELPEHIEVLLDVLWQACGDEKNDWFCSDALSAYRDGIEYLVQQGYLYRLGKGYGRMVTARIYKKYKQVWWRL